MQLGQKYVADGNKYVVCISKTLFYMFFMCCSVNQSILKLQIVTALADAVLFLRARYL